MTQYPIVRRPQTVHRLEPPSRFLRGSTEEKGARRACVKRTQRTWTAILKTRSPLVPRRGAVREGVRPEWVSYTKPGRGRWQGGSHGADIGND